MPTVRMIGPKEQELRNVGIDYTAVGARARCDCNISKDCLGEVLATVDNKITIKNWHFFGRQDREGIWCLCPACLKVLIKSCLTDHKEST